MTETLSYENFHPITYVTVHAIIATLAYAHSHYALILSQECANRLALQRWTSADFHFYCAWFFKGGENTALFLRFYISAEIFSDSSLPVLSADKHRYEISAKTCAGVPRTSAEYSL